MPASSFGRCIALTPLFFSGMAQVVVFWQPDFPTVASRPVERATLYAALHPDFLDLKALQAPGALAKCELLVLPYGSSVPTDAWKAIKTYLQNGGKFSFSLSVASHCAYQSPRWVQFSFRAGRRIPTPGCWTCATPTRSQWREMLTLRGSRAMLLRPVRGCRQTNSSPSKVHPQGAWLHG